jgi:tRNA (guanine-N7-)-methyltransferase
MTLIAQHRLPIQHPEYQYPASKNPYWNQLNEIKGRVFSDNETEIHRGQWRSQFSDQIQNPNRPLHVEIGCNGGHVISEWAKAHPENAYIGIDWKFKQIYKGAEKAAKAKAKNLIFFRAHAERLNYMFGPEEIDYLYLFFPDPWPKKAHWKNRTITAESLKSIAEVMKPTGVFHIKTDHPGYFEWMLNAVDRCKDHWTILEMTRDLHQNHPAPETLRIPEVTLFERLFIRDGIKIQSVKLQKRPLLK